MTTNDLQMERKGLHPKMGTRPLDLRFRPRFRFTLRTNKMPAVAVILTGHGHHPTGLKNFLPYSVKNRIIFHHLIDHLHRPPALTPKGDQELKALLQADDLVRYL